MKRTTVNLDEELLKKAMEATGERTYSAVLNKGLKELVRLADLWRGIEALRTTPNVFRPGYLEEIRPNSWAALEKRGIPYEKITRRTTKRRGRSSR